VQLTDELVELPCGLQPLRVEPTTPLFTNLDGTPIADDEAGSTALMRDETAIDPSSRLRLVCLLTTTVINRLRS
jgi:hypothetical protein